jgi:hypothetical protein
VLDVQATRRARTGGVHRAAITLHCFRLGAPSFPIGALRRAPLPNSPSPWAGSRRPHLFRRRYLGSSSRKCRLL